MNQKAIIEEVKTWAASHKVTSHCLAVIAVGFFTLYGEVDGVKHFVDAALAGHPKVAAGLVSAGVLYLRYSESLKRWAR